MMSKMTWFILLFVLYSNYALIQWYVSHLLFLKQVDIIFPYVLELREGVQDPEYRRDFLDTGNLRVILDDVLKHVTPESKVPEYDWLKWNRPANTEFSVARYLLTRHWDALYIFKSNICWRVVDPEDLELWLDSVADQLLHKQGILRTSRANNNTYVWSPFGWFDCDEPYGDYLWRKYTSDVHVNVISKLGLDEYPPAEFWGYLGKTELPNHHLSTLRGLAGAQPVFRTSSEETLFCLLHKSSDPLYISYLRGDPLLI